MIPLPDVPLSPTAAHRLAQWQSEIVTLPSYSDRVATANRRFEQRNTPRNKVFAEVRRALAEMCSGAQRCGYCEDSAADEVEHVWPKELYPELVFAWSNYLYACGPCNGPKNSRFAVFPRRARRLVEVGRKAGAPLQPPREGAPVLIDPRHEDPMAFFMLDLRGTFLFIPTATRGSREFLRAQYTLEVLRLNARELLATARAEHFDGYRARLSEYVSLRAREAPKPDLERRIASIRRAAHPTVWKEMQRQHALHPGLRTLFRKAPEALSW